MICSGVLCLSGCCSPFPMAECHKGLGLSASQRLPTAKLSSGPAASQCPSLNGSASLSDLKGLCSSGGSSRQVLHVATLAACFQTASSSSVFPGHGLEGKPQPAGRQRHQLRSWERKEIQEIPSPQMDLDPPHPDPRGRLA